MVAALFQPSTKDEWGSLSFVSTLYLCPVLDSLLAQVPRRWQAEVRLGLQEALVNAVKHGNRLDPHKVISVRYRVAGNHHWWVIEDEGGGFDVNCCNRSSSHHSIESGKGETISDCGRGLFILHQVFDEVKWARGGRELHLHKRVNRWFAMPLVC